MQTPRVLIKDNQFADEVPMLPEHTRRNPNNINFKKLMKNRNSLISAKYTLLSQNNIMTHMKKQMGFTETDS